MGNAKTTAVPSISVECLAPICQIWIRVVWIRVIKSLTADCLLIISSTLYYINHVYIVLVITYIYIYIERERVYNIILYYDVI